MQYLIRSPRTELPRNPRKIPEYFEKQIFSLELGFIYGALIWLNNAICAIRRITILMCLKLQFHSPHLHQTGYLVALTVLRCHGDLFTIVA